ncbi:phosphotransferase [Fibrella sp. HMF5335]|uniref:Phosphotransferase n=1 Tax=Fibrella rubiginis TaxID=2817060 RepID=A0A939GHL7_9BACT|nr:phosphotransferase [Fibrella rubiginis]MBO0937625.1 phosphotransferase [Fibrella rubiginis]
MQFNANQPQDLQVYLARNGWISTDEILLSLTKPGEGNMNFTLRVRTNARSLIVKQARPYVEKYPSIAAPVERAVIEGQFYRRIARNPTLRAAMPELLGADSDEAVLVLEDLGESSDYTYLYQGSAGHPDHTLSPDELQELVRFISLLHNQFRTALPDPAFANQAMRTLNAEHLFNYPFLVDNGFDLDTVQPGLQALALTYKQDIALKRIVARLADQYTSNNHAGLYSLLHGDYYPGSWLRTQAGTRVIDPEFCFYGPPEFDLGVMLAHLHMARQPETVLAQVMQLYDRPDGFSENLLRQFTGVEIMRRLIGLAQLPLSLSLAEKETLLAHAAQLVVSAAD